MKVLTLRALAITIFTQNKKVFSPLTMKTPLSKLFMFFLIQHTILLHNFNALLIFDSTPATQYIVQVMDALAFKQ